MDEYTDKGLLKYIRDLQRKTEKPNGVIGNLCRYINGIYNLGWGILERDITYSIKALNHFLNVVDKNPILQSCGLEEKLKKTKGQLAKLYGRTWPNCRRESLIPGRKTG